MTLTEFWHECNRHDWYAPFSDDSRVSMTAEKEKERLLKISLLSEAHRDIFLKFQSHFFSGEPWKSEKKPKPRMPGIEIEAVPIFWGLQYE